MLPARRNCTMSFIFCLDGVDTEAHLLLAIPAAGGELHCGPVREKLLMLGIASFGGPGSAPLWLAARCQHDPAAADACDNRAATRAE